MESPLDAVFDNNSGQVARFPSFSQSDRGVNALKNSCNRFARLFLCNGHLSLAALGTDVTAADLSSQTAPGDQALVPLLWGHFVPSSSTHVSVTTSDRKGSLLRPFCSTGVLIKPAALSVHNSHNNSSSSLITQQPSRVTMSTLVQRKQPSTRQAAAVMVVALERQPSSCCRLRSIPWTCLSPGMQQPLRKRPWSRLRRPACRQGPLQIHTL